MKWTKNGSTGWAARQLRRRKPKISSEAKCPVPKPGMFGFEKKAETGADGLKANCFMQV